MKYNTFSIIVDESTDRACLKHMALVCRTVDSDFNTNDYFLALIPLDEANAETLYNHVIDFFVKNSIEYKKLGMQMMVPML